MRYTNCRFAKSTLLRGLRSAAICRNSGPHSGERKIHGKDVLQRPEGRPNAAHVHASRARPELARWRTLRLVADTKKLGPWSTCQGSWERDPNVIRLSHQYASCPPASWSCRCTTPTVRQATTPGQATAMRCRRCRLVMALPPGGNVGLGAGRAVSDRSRGRPEPRAPDRGLVPSSSKQLCRPGRSTADGTVYV
jgi:hypothetical protein